MNDNRRIAEWLGYRVVYLAGQEITTWLLLRPDGSEIDRMYISEKAAWELLLERFNFCGSDTAALECDDKLHAEGWNTRLLRTKNDSLITYAIAGKGIISDNGPTRAAAITGAVLKLINSKEKHNG